MNQRGLKPGNGASYLVYEQFDSLNRNLKSTKPLIDQTKPPKHDLWLKELQNHTKKQAQKQQSKIDQENERMVNRIVDIMANRDARSPLQISNNKGETHQIRSLDWERKKKVAKSIDRENFKIGESIFKIQPTVPTQDVIKKRQLKSVRQ